MPKPYDPSTVTQDPAIMVRVRAAYGGRVPSRNTLSISQEAGIKLCGRCGRWLDVSSFGKSSGRADGLDNKCMTCARSYLDAWHARPENVSKSRSYTQSSRLANPERTAANRLRDRCRAYGITPERYMEMLAEQNGHCAMCSTTPEQNRRMLAVDHDHACCSTQMRSCGRCVRGLLCSRCNTGLGYIEDPVRARAAAAYLSRGAGLQFD